MPVIEGTAGVPLRIGGTPGAGTDEVQTMDIDATGGSFKLGFGGHVTPAIDWSATNATLLARINTALQGSAEVQTITFGGTPTGGTFRLRFRGQETAAISWSATNNTLRDNVDTALEALGGIGASGVAVAVGTMTAGIGTLTATFAEFADQLPLEVTDNRLTGTAPTVSVARTTTGVRFGPVGKLGIVATAGTLTNGVGTITLTFSGAQVAKRAQPLITVEDNSLTGAGTLTIVETTPGVDADGRGALVGALAVNTTNGKLYVNTGTAVAPTWTLVGGQT